MHSFTATALDRALFSLGFAVLLALAWPGIAVQAEEARDIAPSSSELTGLGSRRAPVPVEAPAAGCEVPDAAAQAAQEARQQAVMRRLAEATGPGEIVPMDGRGVAYERQTDLAMELARLRVEARSPQASGK